VHLGSVRASAIVYDVLGSAPGANLTYRTLTGTEQQSNLAVPLANNAGHRSPIRLGPVPSGTFLYISAQNSGAYGSVTCVIREGKRVLSRNTASGQAAIATCQAEAV
jgi:hypothetical protein